MEYQEKMISREIKKLVPILGKDSARKLTMAWLMADEETRERIFELVDVIKASTFANNSMGDAILTETPPKELVSKGEINFGTVMYGNLALYPFMFRKQALLTHIGIFGSSGYGKTNLSYHLISEISRQGIPVLVFDFSKRNYRDLLLTGIRDSVDVFTCGRSVHPFRFNPLRPPDGVSASQWMKDFAGIFDHAYWLLGGGRYVILKALEGINDAKANPTMKDLKQWVSDFREGQLSSRERNWLSTAQRSLESLMFKEVGEIFNCELGADIEGFFGKGKVTVLELDALETADKTFFIEIILQWIRNWLIAGSDREKLKGVIVLEEAHHVLNREKSRQLGAETVMDLLFREIRELGMGIIYIDQHPSLVSYPALGNTSTQVYMNLGLDTKHNSDIRDAANMLGLDYEEDGGYIRKLAVGQAFVLSRGLGFHDPFIVSFPHFGIRKGAVSDSMLIDIMDRRTAEAEGIYEKELAETVSRLDTQQMEMVSIIGSGKALSTAQIYSALRISGSTFSKKAQALLDAGLVDFSYAKAGKNRLQLHFLTDKGYRLFAKSYRLPEDEEFALDKIIEAFSLLDFRVTISRSTLTAKKKGRQEAIKAALANTFDRDRLNSMLAGHAYFICSSQATKNALLSQLARRCKLEKRQITAYISVGADEAGQFQAIEVGI